MAVPRPLLHVVPAFGEQAGVWRASEVSQDETVVPSGFAALDAALPGGGWPVGSLVELLQARPEQHVWQLLVPALAAHGQPSEPVVLVNAPFDPFGPSLQAQGLASQRLLRVHANKPAARLWAAEQALRCADVAAVLAWLPQAKNAELHRLHLAAQQHGKLLFVLRGLQARNESSPARLRLCVEGTDVLRVHILKRRGPPLTAATRTAGPPRAPGGAAAGAQGQGQRSFPIHPAATQEPIACTGSHCCPRMKKSARPGDGGRCSSRPGSRISTRPWCSRFRPASACGAGASACCAACSRRKRH